MQKTEKQVISGYHRPVCRQCQCEMRPEKNGVGVLDLTESGGEYEVWDADLWKCPQCGIEVVGGFGHGPIARQFQEGFTAVLDEYAKHSLLVRNTG